MKKLFNDETMRPLDWFLLGLSCGMIASGLGLILTLEISLR